MSRSTSMRRWLTLTPKMPVIKGACAGLAIAGLAWGGDRAWAAWQARGTPSCSWPLRVQGTSTGPQAGLVRCYVKGLAQRDAGTLMTVADNTSPVRITKADLKFSADAHAGVATATFTPSPVDNFYVLLTITYANGVKEETGIINLVAKGGPSAWRMSIGTPIDNSGPPPATSR